MEVRKGFFSLISDCKAGELLSYFLGEFFFTMTMRIGGEEFLLTAKRIL